MTSPARMPFSAAGLSGVTFATTAPLTSLGMPSVRPVAVRQRAQREPQRGAALRRTAARSCSSGNGFVLGFAELDREVAAAAVAPHGDFRARVRRRGRDCAAQRARRVDLAIVEARDHVAGLQARRARRDRRRRPRPRARRRCRRCAASARAPRRDPGFARRASRARRCRSREDPRRCPWPDWRESRNRCRRCRRSARRSPCSRRRPARPR